MKYMLDLDSNSLMFTV